MTSCHIVVSKYKEDTSWTENIDKNYLFIYDKSESPIPDSIPRRNIGREGETFLYHIIKYYNNLPDYILLLQGHPFDHFQYTTQEKFLSLLNYVINSRPSITMPLFRDLITENPSDYRGLFFSEYYTFIFNKSPPEVISYSGGCQYIIPKSDILKKSLQFYKRLHFLMLQTNVSKGEDAHSKFKPVDLNIMSAWTFERLAYYIFTASEYNKVFDKKTYLITSDYGIINSPFLQMIKDHYNIIMLNDNSSDCITKFSMDTNIFFIESRINMPNLIEYIGFVDCIFYSATKNKISLVVDNPAIVEYCEKKTIDNIALMYNYAKQHSPPIELFRITPIGTNTS
jgi:hypothetical protein